MNGLALIAEARRGWRQLRALLISGTNAAGLCLHRTLITSMGLPSSGVSGRSRHR